jgi:hypothetical protein
MKRWPASQAATQQVMRSTANDGCTAQHVLCCRLASCALLICVASHTPSITQPVEPLPPTQNPNVLRLSSAHSCTHSYTLLHAQHAQHSSARGHSLTAYRKNCTGPFWLILEMGKPLFTTHL